MSIPDDPGSTIPSVPPPYTGSAPKFATPRAQQQQTMPPQMMPHPPQASSVPATVGHRPPPVPPLRLVEPGARLGSLVIDVALVAVTAGIGWFIWSLITWGKGQSPGGSVMGHVVVDSRTGVQFDRGQMAMRELIVKGMVGWLLGMVSGGIYYLVDGVMIFGNRHMTLHDRMVGSVVCYR